MVDRAGPSNSASVAQSQRVWRPGCEPDPDSSATSADPTVLTTWRFKCLSLMLSLICRSRGTLLQSVYWCMWVRGLTLTGFHSLQPGPSVGHAAYQRPQLCCGLSHFIPQCSSRLTNVLWFMKRVCVFHNCMKELSDDIYLKTAAEFNLAETAFITKVDQSDSFTTGLFIISLHNELY